MTRVQDVERLLQLLSVLQAAEGRAVRRDELLQKVAAYAASSANEQSLKKMMQRDVKALAELGFALEDIAGDGEASTFVLHPRPWRLPIELTAYEQRLLVWVMAAAGASMEDADVHQWTSAAPDLSRTSFTSLIGSLPQALDVAQAALAGGRSLQVQRHGKQLEFEPAQLAARRGRWFLIGRYAGKNGLKAPRLDRLDVLGLGPRMTNPPAAPRDPEEMLDQTAWDMHEQRDAELRCRSEDLAAVASWFPRAAVSHRADGTTALRFWYRNEQALITRLIGLGGAAWVITPDSAVRGVRERALAALSTTS